MNDLNKHYTFECISRDELESKCLECGVLNTFIEHTDMEIRIHFEMGNDHKGMMCYSLQDRSKNYLMAI